MKLFTRKNKRTEEASAETKKLPWYKKLGVKISVVAVAVASILIPTTTSVFAASIQKTYVGMYYNGTVAGMVTYNGDPAYCIQMESHMPQPWGHNGTSGDVYSTTAISSYSGLSDSLKQRITAITYYGYGYNGRGILYYYAAQQAIWDLQGYPNISWSGYATTAQVQAAKNEILADVNNYLNNSGKTSNFVVKDSSGNVVASGQNVSFDKAVVGATYTITDTNGNLSSSTVTSNAFGGRATVSGNTITVKMDTSDYGVSKTISVQGQSTSLSPRGQGVVLYAGSYQNLIVVGTPSGSSNSSSVTLKGYGVPVDIVKNDQNGNKLAGANLSLYQINGSARTLISTYTTTGSAQRFDLCPGTYQLVENSAPNGYYKSQPVTFTVETKPYQTQTFTMTDEPILVGISKIGKTTGDPVYNAHLVVKDSNGNLIAEFDTNGSYVQLPSGKLQAGESYIVTETYNPPGYYSLETPVVIQIPEYKPTTNELNDAGYKVYNVLDDEIDFRVIKVDTDTREAVIGATMQIKDSNGNVIDEWTTDGTEHRIPKEKLTVGQTYSVHEAKAPKGYYSMPKDITFTVLSNTRGTYTTTATDRKICVDVSKEDQDGYTDKVEGSTLRVLDMNNNEVVRWSSQNGSQKIDGLSDGETYIIEELAATDGYYLTSTKKTFTVNAKSATAQEKGMSIEFVNHEIEFYVRKLNSKTKEYMAGAEIQIIDDETGEVIDTVSTGSEKVLIKNLKAGKSYTVHESNSVDGYYYPDSDEHFTVPATWEEASQMDSSDFIITVEDAPVSFKIIKRDSQTHEYVGGALLGIYESEDATEPLYTWETSAEEPETISNDVSLKAGHTYYIRELDTATGYYFNNSAEPFTVPENNPGKTITVDFYNVPIKWNVKKVDTDGNLLTTSADGSYCTLEVYDTQETLDNSDDDTLIATLETNDKNYKKKGYFDMQDYINQGLVQGGHTYRIHEASAANGYRIADDVYTVIEISGDTETVISTMTDEEINVGIMKVDDTGTLLTQVDAIVDNKKKQVGFELTVYNEETGEEVFKFNTKDEEYQKNGYMDISKYLSAQTNYVVKETSVPKGYYQAKDYSFNVDNLTYEEIDGKKVGIIRMVDPTIHAQFRKENQYGDVIFGTGDDGFLFQILDTNGTDDESDDYVVGKIDTYNDSHNDGGWIEIGQYLQEGRTYRIHEYYAPVGYELSETDAYITTPTYYAEETDGSVINVVLSQ